MTDYDFGQMFAGLTRTELVPSYRLNREAPAAERVSFVVDVPTVATLGEWQGLADAAAALADGDGDALLAASRARSDFFIARIVEVRTGANRQPVTDETRGALAEHLYSPARLPLLMEIELMWRKLGVVDGESGNG